MTFPSVIIMIMLLKLHKKGGKCAGMASQQCSIRPRKLSKQTHLKSSTHQAYWLTDVDKLINSETENCASTDQINYDERMRSVFPDRG